MKIIIPFNGKAESEIDVQGLFHAIPWNYLMPTINELVRLRPDEVVEGLIVSEIDIKVKIGRKKGRKTKS